MHLSIIKGICITLMVIGHTGCPEYLGNVIYSFHMPCFFVVSGYLFKEKYILDKMNFLKRRIKGLYWEFIKWSLFFLLFHNAFYLIHFYNTTYSGNDYVNQIFKILTMTGTEQLLGGFWFLKDLLYASIISLFSIWGVQKFCRKGRSLVITLVLTISFYVLLAYILSTVSFKIPTISSEIMLATAYFILGYFMQQSSRTTNLFNLPLAVFASIVVFLAPAYYHGTINNVTGLNIFLFFFSSLFGIYSMFVFAAYLKGRLSLFLDYIGERTLYILAIHFAAFKLVSFVYILIADRSIEQLAEFPVLKETNCWMWLIYSLIGVLTPIIAWRFVQSFKRDYFI